MNKRLKRLEEYRLKAGLSHADISRLIGATSIQSYNNWRYRDSLPKEYYEVVDALLGPNHQSKLDAEILSRINLLDDSQKKAAILHIKALLGEAD